MSKLNGRTEHVAPEEYLEATRKIDLEMKGQNPHAYYGDLAQKTSRQFLRFTREVADILTPVDRVLGPPSDEDIRSTRVAIEGGGLAGLLIARHAYDPVVINAEDVYRGGIEIPYASSDDKLQENHELATELLSYGWEGVSIAGNQTAEILEDWESRFVRDVTKQSLFRVGAGVVFISIRNNFQLLLDKRQEEDRKELENAIGASDGMDWDTAFEKFFTEE